MLNFFFFFFKTTGFICSSVGTCGVRTAFSLAVLEKEGGKKISLSASLPTQVGLGTQSVLATPTEGKTAAVNSSLRGGRVGHSTSNSYTANV